MVGPTSFCTALWSPFDRWVLVRFKVDLDSELMQKSSRGGGVVDNSIFSENPKETSYFDIPSLPIP